MARNPILRLTSLILLFTVSFTTAEAASRSRTLSRGSTQGTLSGKVTDSVTGEPVFGALITIGIRGFLANQLGEYKIEFLSAPGDPVRVTVGRWGYVSRIFHVRLLPGSNTLDAALEAKPVALLTDRTGATYVIDAETASFDSWFPLASPIRADPFVFCQPDGSSLEVPMADIKAVSGPAQPVALPGCCYFPGDSLRFNITLRSGETLEVNFPECNHYLFVLSGHDRRDGRWHYLKLTEFEHLEFP